MRSRQEQVSKDGFAVDYVTLAGKAQQLADLRGELQKGDDAIERCSAR